MGAHESLESTMAAVEVDVIRLHALALVNQYEAHDAFLNDPDQGDGYMGHDAWLAWEGQAYAVLKELARG